LTGLKNIHFILLISLSTATHIATAQDTPLPPSISPQSNLQNEPKPFEKFKDRLYFGGTVGAWFGQTTYVNLSPIIGVKINEKFSVGGGVIYNYYSQIYIGKKYVSTIYGGSAFARYFVLENLFAQVGWDRLSVPDYTTGLIDSRAWIDNILVGGGYRQQFSDNGTVVAMIFYNINQSPLSPYQNPIIQIGFNIGL
jgi:hypothetical protein